MPDQNSKPVVLLIYAHTGEALDNLKPETDAIEAHLVASGLCDVKIVREATLDDVVTAINEPELRDRVSIVHYAGHANGQGIQLQSSGAAGQGKTAYMRGLAEVLIKTQPHLRMLFINACASREQVLELTKAGIPLVIATNQGIDDKVAREFAERFYRTLSQQYSIGVAFQVAAGAAQSTAGENLRSMYFGVYQKSVPAANNELPWELHGPDADRLWSLRDPFYRGTGPRWDHTKYTFNSDSPYLGLRYFGEKESSRFFGRDDFVQTLLKASESAPLLLVIGASGTGKSSVVRAGMIPQWKKLHGGVSDCQAFVFTPQDDPFDRLSASLQDVKTFDWQQIRSVCKPSSKTALRDAVETFGQGEPWLFFVDQFEEIFTRTTDQKKRNDFLDTITDLAKSENSNVCMVLAMRDDFFPQLRDYPELFPLTDKHCFRCAALSREALEEVIQRPAAENGVTLQPGLVAKIVNAIDRQPGALPLLQYALNDLWKAHDLSARLLNTATYELRGGVTGSLGSRLQQLYDQQEDQTGKDQFRWMMLKLVTYDENTTGSSVVSRLAPKTEFAGKQSELLDHLIDLGLVVSSGTSTPSVQLGHEKIIEAWPEFLNLTKESREAKIVRQQLRNAASGWVGLLAHDEKQKVRRALWQGSQLEKALELRHRGDFDQFGGLDSDDNRFLEASYNQSRKLIRRLQWAVGAAVTGLILIAYFAWQLSNAKQIAEKSSNISTSRQLVAQSRELRSTRPRLSLLLAEKAVKHTLDFDATIVPEAHQNLRDALGSIGGMALIGHENGIKCCVVSPDSRWLATGGNDKKVLLWNLNDPSQKAILLEGHTGPILAMACTPDSTRLVSTSSDDTAILWNLSDPQLFEKIQVPPMKVADIDMLGASYHLENIMISSDSKWLIGVVGGGNFLIEKSSFVFLWDLTVSPLDKPKHTLVTTGPKNHTSVSPDSRWVVTSTGHSQNVDKATYKTVLWGLTDDPEASQRLLCEHDRPVTSLAFTPDSKRLLIAEQSGIGSKGNVRVRLFDISKNDSEVTFIELVGHVSAVTRAAVSERWLVTGTADGTAHVWDLETPSKLPLILRGHDQEIIAVSIDSSNRLLLTASRDGTARIWDLNKEDPFASSHLLRGHDDELNDATLSPDGKWIVTVCGRRFDISTNDSTGRLWSLPALSKDSPIQGPQSIDPIELGPKVRITDDGRWALSGSGKNVIYDLSTKQPQLFPISYDLTPKITEEAIQSLIDGSSNDDEIDKKFPTITDGFDLVSPDGRWIYDRFGKGRLWLQERLKKGDNKPILLEHDQVTIERMSHDSKWLATGSEKGTVHLWKLDSDVPIKRSVLDSHSGKIHCMAFCPRSRWLATGGADGTARLWDLNSDMPAAPCKVLWKLENTEKYKNVVGSIAIDSGLGRWLVTGGNDSNVYLWDLTAQAPEKSYKPLKPLQTDLDLGTVNAVDISRDGCWIIAQYAGGKARLWRRDTKGLKPFKIELGPDEGGVCGVAFSPDSRWLLTGNRGPSGHGDNMPRLWDLSLADPTTSPVVLRGHKGAVERVTFSQSGYWMITQGGLFKPSRLWRLPVNELLHLAKMAEGGELTVGEKVPQYSSNPSIQNGDVKSSRFGR